MNIYFSGMGGVGIGPLVRIAKDCGYTIFGSDIQKNLMTNELAQEGIYVNIGQNGDYLGEIVQKNGIDWFVYTAALPDDHPELELARSLGIKCTKRDQLLVELIKEKGLKLIAVAGTHGKTNTTGMLVWTLQSLGIPISYSIGATLPFGPSGVYNPSSKYFIYECDEFDKNFLNFNPHTSLITSIEYDHPDTYPTEESYFAAFSQFIEQSHHVIRWNNSTFHNKHNEWVLNDDEVQPVQLAGHHTRQNATLVIKALEYLGLADNKKSQDILAKFPGTSRRFEKIAPNIYTDYGHTPTEIAATLQMARELSDNVVLVYQPHQNIRQHEIKDNYTTQFEQAKHVYWLPTYLSREDPALTILSPQDLTKNITSKNISFASLDDNLWKIITKEALAGSLVLCMGAGDIDSWLREKIQPKNSPNNHNSN